MGMVTRADLEVALARVSAEVDDPRNGIYGPDSLSWMVSRDAGLCARDCEALLWARGSAPTLSTNVLEALWRPRQRPFCGAPRARDPRSIPRERRGRAPLGVRDAHRHDRPCLRAPRSPHDGRREG